MKRVLMSFTFANGDESDNYIGVEVSFKQTGTSAAIGEFSVHYIGRDGGRHNGFYCSDTKSAIEEFINRTTQMAEFYNPFVKHHE